MTRLLTLLFLFVSLFAYAQPQNDDCGGIIDLGSAPFCPEDTFYTNVNATASDFGFGTNIPACLTSGNSPRDVWFQFTSSTDPTITDYEIIVTGMDDGTGSTPLSTPQLVLYRGFCIDGELLIIDCVEAALGENTATIQIEGLDPGADYFLRVGDYAPGAPNSGTFKICVQEKSPDVLISDGSSTSCAGVLYDSGGPDENYGPNENYVFTICPTDFHQCISFNLEYYNLEADNFNKYDQLIFYDGPDVNAPVISHLGDFDDVSDGENNDGAVCYQLWASSGCLTVQFISDAEVQFEGFKASWECTQESCPQLAQISVDSLADTTTILSYLNTPYATTTIDTIICDNASYGSFLAGDNTDLGIARGLVLTTGHATNAIGPNATGSASFSFNAPGDADLDSLSTLLGDGLTSNDACVIELSVFAYADKLTFEYIFGSEEYKEFVNTEFNDIFAFFASGPGIVGVPQLNNQENIAVIPNTNVPVQINSVNHKTNWQYYRNNDIGQSVQYDGLTADSMGFKKSLTASIDVIPCNTYKLKLAIADRGDSAFDSGVFISEIKAGAPEISVDFKSGLDYLIEECVTSDDILIIALDGAITEPITYTLHITGDAQNGVDYTLTLPDSLTFAPGQTSFSFPISVIDDNITEGTEQIIISLSHDYGCGEVTFGELIIDLKDNIEVNLDLPGDTVHVCINSSNSSVSLSASGAATYLWSPAAIFNDPSSSTPTATPVTNGWVYVTGFAGTCTDIDSIFVDIIDVQMFASASDTTICFGDTVTLNATANVPDGNYTWSGFFWNGSTLQSPEVIPFFSIQYIVEMEKYGCIVTDTVMIEVDTLFEPEYINDTTICLGQNLQLATMVNESSTYQWFPSMDLNQSDISGAVVTTTQGTVGYTLHTTSANGYCKAEHKITIISIDASLNVVSLPGMIDADTLFLCAPDSASLLAQTSTLGVGLTWAPTNGTLSSITDTIVTATPFHSGYYIATLKEGVCVLNDSVYIQIDSLPDLALLSVPIKDPYCPEDTVSLFSQSFLLSDFPNITHAWTPLNGQLSDPDNFNLVVLTEDTITYTRTTTNGICIGIESLTLNVDKPADITISQDKTVICSGEAVQLTASSPDGDEFEWSPETGLSCTECPNPIATPNATISYSVSLKNQNCPASDGATITVNTPPTIQFPTDNNLCSGESIFLNQVAFPVGSYSWTSDDPNFTDTTDPNPTATPSQTSTYTVVASNGDCEITESITVHVADDNLSIEGLDGVCPGSPILLSAVTNGSGSFVWQPDNIESQNITVQPTTATTYSVTYTFGDGCVLTASKPVIIYPLYTVTLNAVEDTVFTGEQIVIQASVDPTLSNPVFKWTHNGVALSENGANITVPASAGPLDEFVATLITPEGCEYSAVITIIVIPLEYELPNAFTPNGDGINETFRPAYIHGYEFLSMHVFNRWGQLVYEGTSDFKGWDGTFNEKDMPADAYPFVMKLKVPDGSTIQVKGDVTLIR